MFLSYNQQIKISRDSGNIANSLFFRRLMFLPYLLLTYVVLQLVTFYFLAFAWISLESFDGVFWNYFEYLF